MAVIKFFQVFFFALLFINFSNLPDSMQSVEEYGTDEFVLHITIRAFIPNEIEGNDGLLKDVNGKVILSGPRNSCFLTDNRGFSLNDNESFRIQTKFSIKIRNGEVEMSPPSSDIHKISNSTLVDCNTGNVISSLPAILKISSIGKPIFEDNQVQIIGQVAGNNPHMESPWIDYSFDFIYSIDEKKLTYSITAGAFPALEVYASLNDGINKKAVYIEASNSPYELFDFGTGFVMSNYEGKMKF